MPDPDLPPRAHNRRILSLWFPRLGAERLQRIHPVLAETSFATVSESGNLRQIDSLNTLAEAKGLRPGQSLSDALVICPDLITRPADPTREAAFLAALRRWAGKFSPWVAEEGRSSLLVDLTGCAHLFGGEAALFDQAVQDCADQGLSVRAGIADTAGAAWALARFGGGQGAERAPVGDAIDQEARATRSRAARRHWVKGGAAPQVRPQTGAGPRIAPPGTTRQALAPLPVAALRLDRDTAAGLARLGLRCVGDVMGLPRAGLARRFGLGLMRRLDQALGTEPEPISPAGAPLHFAVRLSLPDPIGLEEDILAGIDRLLPALCDRLRAKGRGARRLRCELSRVDGDTQMIEIGLARAADQPEAMRPLLAMKLDQIDAGFGIDRLRLIAPVTEPLHARQHKGGWAVAAETAKAAAAPPPGQDLADLIGRLGARVGLEAIHRYRPADSHIPEKTQTVLTAAWSDPHPPGTWPEDHRPRPLTLFRPEPVTAPDSPTPPEQFRWRGRNFEMAEASGPERLAPEWWLDDPNWRSGVRDYWRVITRDGVFLWLFYAHGGAVSGGWFAHGDFA